jgi:hypothetical protein
MLRVGFETTTTVIGSTGSFRSEFSTGTTKANPQKLKKKILIGTVIFF